MYKLTLNRQSIDSCDVLSRIVIPWNLPDSKEVILLSPFAVLSINSNRIQTTLPTEPLNLTERNESLNYIIIISSATNNQWIPFTSRRSLQSRTHLLHISFYFSYSPNVWHISSFLYWNFHVGIFPIVSNKHCLSLSFWCLKYFLRSAQSDIFKI